MMEYGYYQNMMGDASWGVAPFMWLTYLLVVTALVLVIAALLKYIKK